MIKHFEIDSFKSLRSLSLDFGNINIFIGPNGVGKTNILEALGVVSAAAYGVVDDETLLRRGIRPGVPRLYKTSNKKYRTAPHIAFLVESETCSYRVSLLNPLEKPLPKWHFKTEKVTFDSHDIYSRGINSNINGEIGGIPAVLAAEKIPKDILVFFNDLRSYSLYSPNTPTLRGLTPDMQSRIPVGLSGGGLSEGLKD
jgi:energy-coupling factor transporter ATP-binding protein EcfA2